MIMKSNCVIVIICFLAFSLCSTKEESYWENLSPQKQFDLIHSNYMKPEALTFYNDSFILTDDEQSFSLLEYLITQIGSSKFSPLCFYLFNKAVLTADGALAESMGNYCVQLLNKNGPYVLVYLESHPELEDNYLMFVGEYYSYEDNTSFKEFCDTLHNGLKKQNSNPSGFLDKLQERHKSYRDQ